MKLFPLYLLAATSTAFAASMAPVSYHDGTLVSAQQPANCVSAQETSCQSSDFLVRSEGILYSLTPQSSFSSRTSSLDRQPPGTALQVRDDGRHFFVRVGNRESMYLAIETR
jgi:hypothetical protein